MRSIRRNLGLCTARYQSPGSPRRHLFRLFGLHVSSAAVCIRTSWYSSEFSAGDQPIIHEGHQQGGSQLAYSVEKRQVSCGPIEHVQSEAPGLVRLLWSILSICTPPDLAEHQRVFGSLGASKIQTFRLSHEASVVVFETACPGESEAFHPLGAWVHAVRLEW